MQHRTDRDSPQFAEIVPGRTTEVYLDANQTPHDARQPALLMLQGDLPGQVFRLQPGRQRIGRRTDCEIRLREKAVSGHHAEIVLTEAGVSVADLRSTNGTVVNGRKILDPVFLAEGNLLKMGKSVFKYVDSLVEVELSETLHKRANTDEVTGLPNRLGFLSALAYRVDDATAARPVSVIALAIDGIDRVIASEGGRPAADEQLRRVADRLRDRWEGKEIGRIGDEAFAVALTGMPLASAGSAAAGLRTALEAGGVRASIGVACADRAGGSAEALLTRAEEMVAHAREQGGNRVVLS